MEKRREITNSGSFLLPLYTEPEGQDFWLQPGETVEIRADVASGHADFEIDEGSDAITVWPSNGMGYISTWSTGKLLECGYQRPNETRPEEPEPIPARVAAEQGFVRRLLRSFGAR
jgi:hypothetical protein